MTRLFVAVRPSEEVRALLEDLPRAPETGVRWVPPHQWHITLRFLGNVRSADNARPADGGQAEEVDEVRSALVRMVNRSDGTEPPVVELGPVVSRLGRSVVVVPAHGLDRLAGEVTTATAHLGDPPDPRGFHGHLTLARLKGRAACGVTGAPVTASFEVHEIELVASRTHPDGAVHEVIGRFPLRRAENVDPNA